MALRAWLGATSVKSAGMRSRWLLAHVGARAAVSIRRALPSDSIDEMLDLIAELIEQVTGLAGFVRPLLDHLRHVR